MTLSPTPTRHRGQGWSNEIIYCYDKRREAAFFQGDIRPAETNNKTSSCSIGIVIIYAIQYEVPRYHIYNIFLVRAQNDDRRFCLTSSLLGVEALMVVT